MWQAQKVDEEKTQERYGQSTDTRPTRRPTYRPIVPTDTQSRGAQITQDPGNGQALKAPSL